MDLALLTGLFGTTSVLRLLPLSRISRFARSMAGLVLAQRPVLEGTQPPFMAKSWEGFFNVVPTPHSLLMARQSLFSKAEKSHE
jgi:hypothetical protein